MTENLRDDQEKCQDPPAVAVREEISARMPLTDDGAPLDVTQLIRRAEVMRPDYTMPIEE